LSANDATIAAIGIETDASKSIDRIAPNLTGIPETMLWALHNRACEAKRPDSILIDPDSIRIHATIDYDFARHFGNPEGSLAMRAAEIDAVLRKWIARHPDGLVISLGEGLETQAQRVDNGRLRWLSVDLPDAMKLRERFIAPTERFRHIAVSALDTVWMEAAAPSASVFIVAQGLLMYLEPEDVRQLLSDIADRFPGAEIVFDVVPRWFSRLTLLGLNQTPHYRLPPMPWGINRDEVEPTLRRWHPAFGGIAFLDYRVLRGLPFLLARMMQDMPVFRHEIPSLIHITVSPADRRPTEPSKFTSIRKKQMTSPKEAPIAARTIGGMLSEATRIAGSGHDLVMAASQIVAQRMALGMKGALNPSQADHDEFARMVPEKVEAFSAAGMIMLEQSNQATQHMMRVTSEEMMAGARATLGMVGCAKPASLLEAQGKFSRAWLGRAGSNFIAIGMLMLNAQDAVMAPIRQTVAVNAERLGQ